MVAVNRRQLRVGEGLIGEVVVAQGGQESLEWMARFLGYSAIGVDDACQATIKVRCQDRIVRGDPDLHLGRSLPGDRSGAFAIPAALLGGSLAASLGFGLAWPGGVMACLSGGWDRQSVVSAKSQAAQQRFLCPGVSGLTRGAGSTDCFEPVRVHGQMENSAIVAWPAGRLRVRVGVFWFSGQWIWHRGSLAIVEVSPACLLPVVLC